MSDPQNIPIAAIPYELYRSQDAMKAVQEAAELKMDVAPAGGAYINEAGTKVDANGQPIATAQKPAKDDAATDDSKPAARTRG